MLQLHLEASRQDDAPWAAELERLVAIKRILPNIAEDDEFISMFIDEAKISVVAPDTLLFRAVGGRPRMAVNSAHHQAVDRPGNGAVVNAVAPDGVVEGVEHPGYRFALGVQWHPEYAVDPADPLIFRAFVDACRRS